MTTASPDERPRPGRFRRFFRRLLVVGLVGALLLGVVFFVAYQRTEIPNANAAYQSQSSYVYYAGGKSKIGDFAEQNRESIPLADIPKVMQNAVIAAEDHSFWTNKGIDPKGILRAAFSNAQGNATQGASTITQQYVKILYLTQQRTLTRKAKEAFLSLKVQQEYSKTEILEGYLNTIYFGRGAYGVQAAAQAYFGINASELNAGQSAMLAAVLNSPNYLSPDGSEAGRSALIRRYNYVLGSMAEMGTLEPDSAADLEGKLPKLAKSKTSNRLAGQKGFMLTMIKDELQELGFTETEIDSGGLRIETTLTRKAMRAARDAVMEERPEGKKGLRVATASIDVKTGGLMGFYAGQDFLQSQLNWAALGSSPGSTFKPFALAAGIKDGYSLRDGFDGNAPYVFEDGTEVGNQGEGQGRSFGSSINMITATENSVNTAYVDMTDSMEGNGPQKVVDMAVALGIPKDAPGLEPNGVVALGSATVSPIAMANAYATIANGGVRNDWFLVRKVTRASDDKVVYKHEKKPKRALDEDIAADVSYAMQQTVDDGTASKAQNIGGYDAAAKTGTATASKGDEEYVATSWFVGYTPQVATAVMYARGKGNDSLEGFLEPFYGSAYPGSTWTTLMTALMDGMEEESFPEPAYVDGDAPESGHYVPPVTNAPAPPAPEPEKPKKKKKKQTQEPRPTQQPTTPPPPSPTDPPKPTKPPKPTTPPPPEPTLPPDPPNPDQP